MTKPGPTTRTWLAALLLAASGCATDEIEVASTYTSYDEFRATVRQDRGTGIFIVDGDHPIEDEAGLRAYYERTGGDGQALAVLNYAPDQGPSADEIWRAHRRALSYCVSRTFGDRYAATISAMAVAAADWERTTDVDFIHVPREDGACNTSNSRVLFRVIPAELDGDLALAFYPDFERERRHVQVDSASYGHPRFSLAGILRHELGHVLGFVHEHVRPEAGPTCRENISWRDAGPYDSASVMHYPRPNCAGTNTGDYVLTALDRQGATAIYGAPGRKRSDVAAIWNHASSTSVDVFRSIGTSFGVSTRWATQATRWSADSRFVSGDFDADGNVDLVEIQREGNKNTFKVYLSNGSSFTVGAAWATRKGDWSGVTQWLPGDYDGDGLVDLAAVWNDHGFVSIWFYRSTGTTFEDQVGWTNKVGDFDVTHRWVSGDFDGNRATDIAAIWNDGGRNSLTVRRSTGGGFTHEPWGTRQGPWAASDQWLAGDYDGDGRSDLVRIWKDGNFLSAGIHRAAGLAFAPYSEWQTREGGWINGILWTGGDFDADGRSDLLAIWNNPVTQLTVRRSTGSSFTHEQWSPQLQTYGLSTVWRGGAFDAQ